MVASSTYVQRSAIAATHVPGNRPVVNTAAVQCVCITEPFLQVSTATSKVSKYSTSGVPNFRYLPIAYVVRQECYVLTRVCLSVHTYGGTLARSRWGGGVPWPGPGGTPARGVPHLGHPSPCRAWLGGTPPVRPGLGGTPSPIRPGWGFPPARPDRGRGTPPRVTDGVLDTPRSVCLLPSRRRTFL